MVQLFPYLNFFLKTSKTRGFLLFMEPVKSVLEFKLPLEWFPFPDPPSKSRVDFTIFIARMVPSCWSVHSLIVPMHRTLLLYPIRDPKQ